MGLRDLLDKGKCLIGLHEGPWIAGQPDDCHFTRRCVRCAAEHHKVEHPWADWQFSASDACDQQRTCPRCSAQEARVMHSFGEPHYAIDTSCDQETTCARCGATHAATQRHVMDRWRFTSADACTQVEQCSRCSVDGTRTRNEHAWADWQHSNAHNGAVRVCRRCGELEVKAHGTVTMTGLAPVTPGSVPVVDDAAIADLLARAGAQASPATAPQRDTRLVGQWRHTDSMSSGGFSLVTDTHLALNAEGQFARWTHSVSGMGENTSEPFRGTWSTTGSVLLLSYDDGDEGRSRYEVHDRELLMADWSSQKFWERTR